MTTKPGPLVIRQGCNGILFDQTLLNTPDDNLFNTAWLAQNASIEPTASGRGESWYVNFQNKNQQWVLRHYLRGGLVAKLNRDVYTGWRIEQTRSWKEWRLLHQMHSLQLPVPRPVAARAQWLGSRFSGLYRADILLEKIPQCSTLSTLLQNQALPPTTWRDIGKCIKEFHAHGVYHADLNANNILINAQQKIYLIDFDRCAMTSNAALLATNLPRLQRSLKKLQHMHPVFNFTEQNWQTLVAGYTSNSSA